MSQFWRRFLFQVLILFFTYYGDNKKKSAISKEIAEKVFTK